MTTPTPVAFWERPLATLTPIEWEALCDGCGKCCLHKIEEADTGRIYPTNLACKLLDCGTARCRDYANRKAIVPDCLTLTRETVDDYDWLPATCAYRLRAANAPLPAWHYLICGDEQAVHRAGASVVGWAVNEYPDADLEDHLLEHPI